MKKYNSHDTQLICSMVGYYKYDKETTLRKYFENTVDMPFENRIYSVITDYDSYLKHVYGYYMKLPSKKAYSWVSKS